jgi:hypothetical protein
MAALVMFAVCVWSGIVMLKNHSLSSTWAFLLDYFLQMAKLLTVAVSSDGQVPLKQFITDNHLHIPPDAAFIEAHKPFLGCSFRNRVFSIDGTDVSGRLCSFGAPVELVKNMVSEMFIFLNLTLHSFGRENFVPLVQIGKFLKGSIEEIESYELVYYTSQHAILVGKKSSKTKTAQMYAPTQYFLRINKTQKMEFYFHQVKYGDLVRIFKIMSLNPLNSERDLNNI